MKIFMQTKKRSTTKVLIILTIIMGVASLAVYFITKGMLPGTKQENAMNNIIEIKDYSFIVEKVIIKKGTTLTWINQDIARHSVVLDDESKIGPESPLLATSESYSFRFEEKGLYRYHCEPHPYMHGVIEVVD